MAERRLPGMGRSMSEKVGSRERRRLRARANRDRTLWLGIGMIGMVGWSIAIPTLAGIFLGLWLDRNWPGTFSWTLALLLAGLSLGCISAWYWVSREQQAIEAEESGE